VPSSLLDRKETHFVLWRPGAREPPPKLVIGVGVFTIGSAAALTEERAVPMTPAGESGDVWEVSAASLGLRENQVYHYWFEVPDTAPFRSPSTLRCTDPAAYAVDWRLRANGGDNDAAAALVRWRNGKLIATDAEGDPAPFDLAAGAGVRDVPMASLPANNRLVIYELPTAWTKIGDLVDAHNVGTGTFRDVRALIEGRAKAGGGHFTHLRRFDHRHLLELGVNALELLPPADTFADRKSWGYATSNYFAPDFDLGRPLDPTKSAAANDAKASTAVGELLALVRSCHNHGIRFFYDAVMAFANHDPYRIADFLDFHVFLTDLKNGPFDHLDPEQDGRDGFGGDLWKYGLPSGPTIR